MPSTFKYSIGYKQPTQGEGITQAMATKRQGSLGHFIVCLLQPHRRKLLSPPQNDPSNMKRISMTHTSFCLGLYPSRCSQHLSHCLQNLLHCFSQSGTPKHSPVFWVELTEMEKDLLGAQALGTRLLLLVRAAFPNRSSRRPCLHWGRVLVSVR